MFTVKNWDSFQHYKSKNGEKPFWIKLYLSILDDYEFQNLPVECRALLPMLWLLASETNGVLKDYASVAFRLRQDSGKVQKTINLLVEKGSGALSYKAKMIDEGSTGTKYVAQAVTWLNQERWTDEAKMVREQEPLPPPAYHTYGDEA